MSDPTALRRLAHAIGIEFFYHDIAGGRHEASVETLAAIAGAMGFDVSSVAGLREAIDRAECGPWRRWLKSATVFDPWFLGGLEITIPSDIGGRSFSWVIEEEGGQQHAGDFKPADLPITETRQLDGQSMDRRAFPAPAGLRVGYHRLTLTGPGRTEVAQLIVVPRHCYLPAIFRKTKERAWSLSTHLFTVRSKRNWGIGDFTDLDRLLALSDELGAAGVAVNPFHALFSNDPNCASPYSPSSRLFLNPLYLDVEAVADFGASAALRRETSAPHFQQRLAELRVRPTVDYEGVSGVKSAVFERLYESFLAHHSAALSRYEPDFRVRDFEKFQQEAGIALDYFAIFQALEEVYGGSPQRRVNWRNWPEPHRRPDSAEVIAFAAANAARVEYHKYLQWQADRQLAAVSRAAQSHGLPIGLCRDLAVGADANGADAWAQPGELLGHLRIGAPPDSFSPAGQEWGVLPLNPRRLQDEGYQPFIDLLRANMRHAGALRIDHAMGLQRLFCIPEGGKPREGAYVRYPFDDLIGIVALESRQQRCLVIGEDLGTVTEGFRHRMHDAGMFGCRVLYFEKNWQGDGQFRSPDAYASATVAMVATHDLPTLAGFWEARDIAVRADAGLYADTIAVRRAMEERRRDRALLFQALIRHGFLSPPGDSNGNVPECMTPGLALAIHLFLASTPSQLLSVQLDDVLGEADQINLPGTVTEYANWRRKLSVDLEELIADRRLRNFATAIGKTRGS